MTYTGNQLIEELEHVTHEEKDRVFLCINERFLEWYAEFILHAPVGISHESNVLNTISDAMASRYRLDFYTAYRHPYSAYPNRFGIRGWIPAKASENAFLMYALEAYFAKKTAILWFNTKTKYLMEYSNERHEVIYKFTDPEVDRNNGIILSDVKKTFLP